MLGLLLKNDEVIFDVEQLRGALVSLIPCDRNRNVSIIDVDDTVTGVVVEVTKHMIRIDTYQTTGKTIPSMFFVADIWQYNNPNAVTPHLLHIHDIKKEHREAKVAYLRNATRAEF